MDFHPRSISETGPGAAEEQESHRLLLLVPMHEVNQRVG